MARAQEGSQGGFAGEGLDGEVFGGGGRVAYELGEGAGTLPACDVGP